MKVKGTKSNNHKHHPNHCPLDTFKIGTPRAIHCTYYPCWIQRIFSRSPVFPSSRSDEAQGHKINLSQTLPVPLPTSYKKSLIDIFCHSRDMAYKYCQLLWCGYVIILWRSKTLFVTKNFLTVRYLGFEFERDAITHGRVIAHQSFKVSNFVKPSRDSKVTIKVKFHIFEIRGLWAIDCIYFECRTPRNNFQGHGLFKGQGQTKLKVTK